MPADQPISELTSLLSTATIEDDRSIDRLVPYVYDELRQIAHRQLMRVRSGQTYCTTELVHEAYLRLVDQTRASWQDRLHFLAASARAMRHILIDYARRSGRIKRGGGQIRITLDESMISGGDRAQVFIALDKALNQLAMLSPRLAQVVELRFFGGMNEGEMAELLGMSERTVRRDWRKAKAWLADALAEPDADQREGRS